VAPPGNQAANGENKHQPTTSGETGLLDYFFGSILGQAMKDCHINFFYSDDDDCYIIGINDLRH